MERLREIVAKTGAGQWGACPYAQVLPLLPVRSRSRVPADAQSVIVFLFGYYTGEYPNRNVSRYAIPDDYHTIIREILENCAEEFKKKFNPYIFIPFVDSSPVAEVRAAYACGLGDIGLNGQLLSPVYGSYCFIGEIVTNMPLVFSDREPPKLCTGCKNCIRACPTGALGEDGFQKERCRSQITQKKQPLTEWEREQVRMGGFVWGCDRCTDACPLNRRARPSSLAAFYQNPAPVVTREQAPRLCGEKAYGWRGENLLLRNLDIISGKDMV